MIDGIVAEVARSIEQLREMLDPSNIIVDLTGPDAVVNFRHLTDMSVESPTESV